MARTVADVALFLSSMVGAHAPDPLCLVDSGATFRAPLARSFKGTRIAWFKDLGGIPFETEITRVVNASRQAFLDCLAADGAYDPANAPELPTRQLDAYRRLGNAFAEIGGGLSLPIGGRAAVQFNLNALLLLPSVGVVLQPSLGMSYGL